METQRSNVSPAMPTRKRRRRVESLTVVLALPAQSDDWWDLDAAVLAALASGAKSPAEIGQSVGISESSAASLVAMLAQNGKIRIRLVELAG